MKLVYVLEYYYPNIGGVETLFKSLIDSLAVEGHEITIITSQITPDSPLKEQMGKVLISRMPFNNRYLFTFLGFFYLLPHVRTCDFLHTTSYNAAVPAFFAGKLFGKKVIITFHEVWASLWFQLPFMGKLAKYVHYLFEQMLLKLPFDHFIGVSQSTSDNLLKAEIPTSKISTIYNGINYTDFQPQTATVFPKSKKFTFTYFGRLGISKGLDLLMAAIPKFRQQHPDCQIKLIIPTVPADFLEQIHLFIQKNKLVDYVTLLHELPFADLKGELLISDCVIIPSYSEGFCFAAVETIALGIPVISSDQTALREVVSGQFIKMTELSSEALFVAMGKAVEGKWERRPIKKFELSTTIDQYKKLYQRILNE